MPLLGPAAMLLSFDLAPEAIKAAVKEMGLGWLNSLLTRWILHWLRKRAYSQDDFRQMVRETSFRTSAINCDRMGLEVSLWK